jgi:hypothetical protein
VLLFYGLDSVEDFEERLLENFGVSVLELLVEFLSLRLGYVFCWIRAESGIG